MPSVRKPGLTVLGCSILLPLIQAPAAHATEVVVKNDSVIDGSSAIIQAGFVQNERAAAWLTSPCAGTIVAVQVFWASVSGGTGQSIEDSITIFTGGSFPNPGGTQTVLVAPVMNDGVLNEFRFLDENNTVPINVPVTAGQTFVVSFKFGTTPSPSNGPSVVTDSDGCQNGRNGIFAIPPGIWFNGCSLGISGDFFIRAVVDCPDAQGACCLPGGVCEVRTQNQCTGAGGIYRGNNTVCGTSTCNGACCLTNGTCLVTSATDCSAQSGAFRGTDTSCTPNPCVGACCLPSGGCADGLTQAACQSMGGVYKGDTTQCAGVFCNGACCYYDGNCQYAVFVGCQSGNGVWHGPASTCQTVTCPLLGACCLNDGSCVGNKTSAECTALGGFFKGNGTDCASAPCEAACCFGGGTCLNLKKTDCDQIGGSVWQGPAFPCRAGNVCPTGACCKPDGICVPDTTPVGCSTLGGSYRDNQTCAQANCPIPMGACCLSNGNCINNMTAANCGLIMGSTWAGASTLCRCDCYPPGPSSGDMNNDAKINSGDVQTFVNVLLGASATDNVYCRADFNGDDMVSLDDVPPMVTALLTAP